MISMLRSTKSVGQYVRSVDYNNLSLRAFTRDFYLSLERAIGKHDGEDKKLIASGEFHAYITPDLPEAAGIDVSTISNYAPPGMLNVRTVAAQVSTRC